MSKPVYKLKCPVCGSVDEYPPTHTGMTDCTACGKYLECPRIGDPAPDLRHEVRTLHFALEIDRGGVRVFFHGTQSETVDVNLGYFKDLAVALTVISAQTQAEGL